MKRVQKTKSTHIHMDSWILEASTVGHFCNTAACICGYQAISGNLSNFKQVSKTGQHYLDDTACEISLNITAEEPVEYLGASIYDAYSSDRKRYAKTTGLFSESELDVLNHLNTNELKAEDVIEYLELVIDKVNNM